MLILIGIVPAYFALDHSFIPSRLPEPLSRIEQVIKSIDSSSLSASDKAHLEEATVYEPEVTGAFFDVGGYIFHSKR